MLPVHIPESVVAAMAAHAEAEAPDECCGLLVGSGDRIVRADCARNVRASPTRYLIEPTDHLAAIRSARLEGLDVVGAYHSHPASAPVPSQTDRAEAWPDFLYVIVRPRSEASELEVRAYRLEGGNFREEELVRVP